MKILYILRHGKSDWKAEYTSDINRPLSKRGIIASKKIGKFLFINNSIPNLVISSTATRAKDTARIAIKSGNWNSKLIYNKYIYYEGVSNLHQILRYIENDEIICIVGHEPTLSKLISSLTDSEINDFKTASLAKITFDKNFNWQDINSGCGNLEYQLNPKDII